MGYRSDIAWSTSKEGFEFLKKALTKKNAEHPIDYPLWGKGTDGDGHGFDILDEAEDGVVFGFENIKWYPTYDDVRAFEACVDELDDAGFPWISVRIGEDYDDIEVTYGNDGFGTDIPHLTPSSTLAW